MNSQALVLLITPILLLLAVVTIWKWWHSLGNRRAPSDEKLLRAPGEWLTEQQGEIEIKIIMIMTGIFFGPTIILAQSTQVNLNGIEVAVCVVTICVAIFFMWKLLTKSSNFRLGLLGERAVGEELNKLMLNGCHVYHDFKKDQGGNIDHVIIAPSGVYCVETKCRRKRKGKAGRKEHEIIFDGERLHFPHGSDTHGVQQTLKNSSELARWLSSATGEKIAVKGILTFPGWYVSTRKMSKNLRVLNPKQIPTAIASDKELVLDSKLTQQIVHQLEQRCRNVKM